MQHTFEAFQNPTLMKNIEDLQQGILCFFYISICNFLSKNIIYLGFSHTLGSLEEPISSKAFDSLETSYYCVIFYLIQKRGTERKCTCI